MKHFFTFTKTFCLMCILVLISTNIYGQDAFWNETKEGSFTPKGRREIIPQKFKLYALDIEALRATWENAPKGESFEAPKSNFIVRIPTPSGTMENFRLVRTQLLSPSTQASSGMQDVRTFTAQGIEDPTATLTVSFTIFGFNGMVLSAKGLYYIDPYSVPDTKYYMVYFRNDYISKQRAMETKAGCQTTDADIKHDHNDHKKDEIKYNPNPKNKNGENSSNASARPSGTQQRKYRIAYAATLNYTNFQGNRANPVATTDPARIVAAKNAITVTTNRLKAIYGASLQTPHRRGRDRDAGTASVELADQMQRRDELGGAPELHGVLQGTAAVPAHPQGPIGGDAADADTGLRHVLAEELQPAAATRAGDDRRHHPMGGIRREAAERSGIGHQLRRLRRHLQTGGVVGRLHLERRRGQPSIEQRQMVVIRQALAGERLALSPQRPMETGGQRRNALQRRQGARPRHAIREQQQTPLQITQRQGRGGPEVAIGRTREEPQRDQPVLQRRHLGAA